jgi:hypothetical protein
MKSPWVKRSGKVRAVQIESIKTWLRNNDGFGNEDLFSLYLTMINKAGGNFSDVAKEAITHCPTCLMLQKIASLESHSLQDYMSGRISERVHVR